MLSVSTIAMHRAMPYHTQPDRIDCCASVAGDLPALAELLGRSTIAMVVHVQNEKRQVRFRAAARSFDEHKTCPHEAKQQHPHVVASTSVRVWRCCGAHLEPPLSAVRVWQVKNGTSDHCYMPWQSSY